MSAPEKPESKFDIWWNSPPVKAKIGAFFSIGATVVIVGAMFKILHLPGASIMLGFGMTIEAILFMLGVLDKPHKEYHWEKVFDFDAEHPMSGGMGGASAPAGHGAAGHGAAGHASSSHVEASPVAAAHAAPAPAPVAPAPANSAPATTSAKTVNVNFTESLSDSDVKMLSEGIKGLTTTAKQISNIANVAVASEKFVKSIDEAAVATTKFTKSQDALGDTSTKLNTSYQGIATSISQVEKNTSLYSSKVEEMAKGFSAISSKGIVEGMSIVEKNTKVYAAKIEEISKDFAAISTKGIVSSLDVVDKSAKQYVVRFDEINKNLSSINSIYEIQLKSIQANTEGFNQYADHLKIANNDMTSINTEVKKIVQSTKDASLTTESFKINTEKLSKQIADLNSVYGNMLNALS